VGSLSRERINVMVKRASIPVSLDFLAELLNLPEGTTIIGVGGSLEFQSCLRALNLIVEHPSLDECPKTCMPNSVLPTINEDGDTIWQQRRWHPIASLDYPSHK